MTVRFCIARADLEAELERLSGDLRAHDRRAADIGAALARLKASRVSAELERDGLRQGQRDRLGQVTAAVVASFLAGSDNADRVTADERTLLELASLDSRIELMLSAEAKLEADLGAGKQQIASIIEAIDLAIDREIDARSARALETARKAKRGYLDAVADLQCWTPDGLTMPVNRQVPVPREIAREIAEAGKLRNDLHESVVTLQGYAPRADHGAALRAEFRRIYIDRERPAPEVAAA